MLVSEIIQQAFRESNLIPVGTSPNAAEQTEALAVFNRLVNSLYGFELGENMFDWQVPFVYTAPYNETNPRDPYGDNTIQQNNIQPVQNRRLVTQLSANTTVYFPQFPNDGARMGLADTGSGVFELTINGNGRLIEGAASVTVTPATDAPRAWLYRADLGEWVRVDSLATSDDSPFPEQFDDMLVAGLCIRLAPRYGVQVDESTALAFNKGKTAFKARYRQITTVPGRERVTEFQSVGVPGWWYGPYPPGSFSQG